MLIVVIDGQGGGIGRQLIESIRTNLPSCTITAVGTNSVATANMLRAGAHRAATGENAVKVACRAADIIVGPLGIIAADALLGEISPEMARCVGQSAAHKILIPVNQCDTFVVGVSETSVTRLVSLAVEKMVDIARGVC